MTFQKPKDECGIIGMFDLSGGQVGRNICYGLFALQHRGSSSCGIITNDSYKLSTLKGSGLVNQVFSGRNIPQLIGNIGIGHVLNANAPFSSDNIQPITSRYSKGTMALAKNGYISNAAELRAEMEDEGAIFQSTHDTEVILHMMARARTRFHSAQESMIEVMGKIRGAYSMILMSPKKIMAIRDPNGFRPLCMGMLGECVVFASESCALDAIGATFVRDIEPGEIVSVDSAFGIKSYKTYCGGKGRLCYYEFTYFARPDSVIDCNHVSHIRERAGELLAKYCPAEADVVVGIPDGGAIYAQGFSKISGLPLKMGILKNKFSSRNLFFAEGGFASVSVKLKLSILKANVDGKRVVLVDDSLVKGDTAAEIIGMLKAAGASEVHLRIGSPKILHPCPFGVEMPAEKEMLASTHKSDEEMCRRLGCDSIGFLPHGCKAELGLSDCRDYCGECFGGSFK